jgi:hypothetical protein
MGQDREDRTSNGAEMIAPLPVEWDRKFEQDLAADVAVERRLFAKELGIVLVIALLLLLRQVLQ